VVTPAAAAPAATATPAAVAEPKTDAKVTRTAATTGLRRRSGAPRVRRWTWLRNVYSYVGAFLPLFGAFLVLLGAFWVYTYINPPPPEPQQRWEQIEKKHVPQIDAARLKINAPTSDFATKIQGFKDYSAALKSWMAELQPIKDWTVGAVSTASADYVTAGTEIEYFITDGNQEAGILDLAAAAKDEADLRDNFTTRLAAANSVFEGEWSAVRQYLGLAPYAEPTLALPPTLSPSTSPGASGSPGTSAVPSALPTASPQASPSASPKASAS
jgi:hypothetical protein